MMRRLLLVLVGFSVVSSVPSEAQTHKVAAPQTVVRAVGVYEWTGDLAKPTGSRLVPVTVFIDGQLQDAGVYLARPVPLALQSGNLYELQEAGTPKGTLELSYAKHLQAVEAATGASLFDDGWFGYGSYKAPAAERKAPALRASTQLSEVKRSGGKETKDDGRPHFSNRGGAADSDSAKDSAKDSTAKDSGGKPSDKADADSAPVGSATPADADRPTMRRRSGSSDSGSSGSSGSSSGKSSTASSAGTDTSTPADDPDRPHLTKKKDDASDVPGDPVGSVPGNSNGGSSGGGSGSGTNSAPTTAQGGSKDDPDRPTLKRRTADEMKKDRKREDSASVTGVGSLNNDPDRPTIHRGKPASAMTEEDLPKLSGLPANLKQMAAVSDAANRPLHEFARPWEDDAERKAILTKMQVLARAKLASYGVTAAKDAATAAAAAPAPKATTPAARRAAALAAKKKAAAAPPEVTLQEEELKGYTLSYGGLATYVYTAHTAGIGASLDYVTVVAQADALGDLKVAMDNVTDAAHLDRTPRMRLVDAVDVEASNRASLLFELRGQRERQFGLYSVIGARADQKFLSGTTQ